VTTATRRLRRTGAATLVAAVTAGVTLLATSTSAFAAFGTVTNQVDTTTGATTIYPGTTAAAVGSDDLNLTNAFNIGDTITVSLGQHPGCGTTAGAIGFSATPTVTASGPTTGTFGSGTASADASSTATPTFTVATQSSAGACTTAGVKDQLLITFTDSAAGVTSDNFELVIGGQTVNVGSAVTTGAVAETSVTTSGATVVTVAAAPTIATVANTKASVSSITSAVASGATQTVGVGTITLSDVGTAKIITPPITLTTSAGVFTTGVTPTLTGPTGSTWTVTGQGTATLTFAAGGTALPTTNNTYTITGATVDVPAGNGAYSITAKYTGAVVIGAPFVAIAVSAQSRVGGVDRYASSAQLFNTKFGVSTVHSVVLASGANFPDALSATYLAATLGTGVVLTDPNLVPQQTAQVLTNGFITTVYIVGGTAAISASEQAYIETLHTGNAPLGPLLTVLRVAGPDRYATNNAADLFSGAGAGSTTAIVAVGTNFADALAAGPASYAGAGGKPFPLILTDGTTLSASAQSTLVNLGIKNVVIVGGTAAVSAGVEAAIKALPGITIAYRIAGADRTLTASMIATWEVAGLPATSTYGALASLTFLHSTTTNAYIARGDGFADALSAGAVAGSGKLVILLTGDPNTLGAGIPSYLGSTTTGTFTNVGGLIAVGLTGAVSNATFAAAVASL